MAGIKTLADGRILLVALTTKPAKFNAPTVQELNQGKRISCQVSKADYQLGATGDAEIAEQAMCAVGDGKAPGQTSYDGQITVFRLLDEAGKPDADSEIAWNLLKTKGATLHLVEREGPDHDAEFAEGQEVSVYEVIVGTPTKPSNRFDGYIKRTSKLHVQNAVENIKLTA